MTIHSGTVAEYRPGRPERIGHAPIEAMYAVRWSDGSADFSQTLGGTARYFRRGAPIGFCTDDSGAVVALAGSERIVLNRHPRAARRFAWYYRVKQPSHLTKETQKVLTALGEGLVLVTGIAAMVGLAALDARWDGGDHHHHHGADTSRDDQ